MYCQEKFMIIVDTNGHPLRELSDYLFTLRWHPTLSLLGLDTTLGFRHVLRASTACWLPRSPSSNTLKQSLTSLPVTWLTIVPSASIEEYCLPSQQVDGSLR